MEKWIVFQLHMTCYEIETCTRYSLQMKLICNIINLVTWRSLRKVSNYQITQESRDQSDDIIYCFAFSTVTSFSFPGFIPYTESLYEPAVQQHYTKNVRTKSPTYEGQNWSYSVRSNYKSTIRFKLFLLTTLSMSCSVIFLLSIIL